MPQKRKRKRTRVKPGPILVLAFLVVFFTGVYYSPITSLSKASVEGARPEDRATIESVLGKLNGIPWTKVKAAVVETGVQQIQAVDHASYSQNIFGRGQLVVHYRIPVARVSANRSIGMDASGVMFETVKLPDNLPLVLRPVSATDLPLSIAGSYPSTIVAQLAMRARTSFPNDPLKISFNKDGALCLNIGAGLVILGASDDLDLKLHTLTDMLEQQPDLLAKFESLNLTEPSHPATRKRN